MPVESVRAGEVDDDIVREWNQLVALVNELKTVLNRHITDGQHRVAPTTNAASVLAVNANADTFHQGY